MKKILLIIFATVCSFYGFSQTKVPGLDKSPMDMSYYPPLYPLLKIQDKVSDPLTARVIYSRPQKNGRVIFGDLIEYNKVWRLGANEATEIEFFQNVKINNVKVKKGRYTLYAIPDSSNWTIILNKDNDTWGSFKYDKSMDIVRMDVAVDKQPNTAEAFTMYFDKSTEGFALQMLWDDIKVTLPISISL